MTTDFDILGELFGYYRKGLMTSQEEQDFESMLEEAVEQASSRQPKQWNYEKWLATWLNSKILHKESEIDTFYGFKNSAKMEFIDDTHSKLDHTDKWHLKVFNRSLTLKIFKLSDKIRDRLRE